MTVPYRLDCVWPSPSESCQEEVVRFWAAESALQEREGRQRAPQLLVVARDPDDRVAAVSTAVPILVEQLGFECFYFRTFVGRAHRIRGLGSTGIVQQMLLKSHEYLNQRFAAGHDPMVLGLYMQIENRNVMIRRNEAIWRDGGANVVYIGRTTSGQHVRVWYFDGARIPQLP